MESSTSDANRQMAERHPDWLPFVEAVMRVSEFSSIDEVIYCAFNAWLTQLTAELRWRIAIDLYTNGEISTGRAAEVAGLNYFVFEEKLREHKIPFMAAEPATGDDLLREEALLRAGFNFPTPNLDKPKT